MFSFGLNKKAGSDIQNRLARLFVLHETMRAIYNLFSDILVPEQCCHGQQQQHIEKMVKARDLIICLLLIFC